MSTAAPANIADARAVLVIGGTSGIGRALAGAINALPSKPTVIVAGRRKDRLDELANAGFQTVQLDVTAPRDALRKSTHDILAKYPDLDAVIFSNGIQILFDFTQPENVDLDTLETEFNTNYIAVAALITFFLPHFLNLSTQGRPSFLVPIASSLGLVPGPWTPNYSATKAALHSLTLSLHFQLQDTRVHIMEILPPLVESELHDRQGKTPALEKVWMPLDVFTRTAMDGLLRGDLTIAAGPAAQEWDAFEKGKLARIAEAYARVRSAHA